MDVGKLFGRSLAFPPRVGQDGRLAWSEGADNIRESIQIILLTEPRERLMLPEFGGGLRSFLFEPNTASTRRLVQQRIEDALRRWEPRIKLLSVTVEPDSADDQAAIATVHYELIANQTQEQVNVRVALTGQGGR